MKTISLILFAIAQPADSPPATPTATYTETQQRDLFCVAALAIVASEQQRGVESALAYPLLVERGREYAGRVGERIMAETGQTREQVGNAIKSAVETHQDKAMSADNPDKVVKSAMAKCLPVLDSDIPPKPKPTLGQCAAMLQLAYDEVYRREGLSKTAQDLKTLAFVLDNRAREKMKAEGYSSNEQDIVLTRLREDMLAEAKVKEGAGESSNLDYDHCFALAAPEDKQQKFEH
jgi:hypothetical protein